MHRAQRSRHGKPGVGEEPMTLAFVEERDNLIGMAHPAHTGLACDLGRPPAKRSTQAAIPLARIAQTSAVERQVQCLIRGDTRRGWIFRLGRLRTSRQEKPLDFEVLARRLDPNQRFGPDRTGEVRSP